MVRRGGKDSRRQEEGAQADQAGMLRERAEAGELLQGSKLGETKRKVLGQGLSRAEKTASAKHRDAKSSLPGRLLRIQGTLLREGN